MISVLKYQLSIHWQGVRNSYTQVFFSDNKWFALMLFLSTFIDPYAGMSGLLAIVITHCLALWLGLNENFVRNGSYGYNSLMVGLVLGVYYKFSVIFVVILFMGSLFCLILSVFIGIIFDKYKVPYLSLPFLFTIWIMLLSSRNYHGLVLSERGIYTINELAIYGGNFLIEINESINSIKVPLFIEVYLKSLGAIIFQYNIVSGLLIAIGLLLYSRIAFTLSLIGYSTGFVFYFLVEENFTQLIYSYIGFNFILLAIALGGFFLIPSTKSYLLVFIATPLTAILISAFSGMFSWFQLPMYSLSFNIIAILFLFILNFRHTLKKPELVGLQLLSPEKNLYAQHNRVERFKNDTYFHISLPFYGEWTVSQGYDGGITHKDEWKYALDFVVTDELTKTYRDPATDLSHFYCYNLPVIATASGWVVELVDDILDNEIGDVDLNNNWGNTIIIKHSEFLYTKLSHFKKGTFKVKLGDYIHKGTILGYCGSSGRSPEPHLHFQLQATPYIGSQTIHYPISYYIVKDKSTISFHSFEVPKENQVISKIAVNELMKNAFHFIPGKTMKFQVIDEDKIEEVKWEVFTNSLNQAYLYCSASHSTAYFINNEVLHYFTEFYGDKKSLLYTLDRKSVV